MNCLIVIPAYNEEKNIHKVITKIKESDLNKYEDYKFDIVVVNDCSADNTRIEAERAGAKVLSLSSNLGIGGAVQTGYLYAYYNNYDAVVQLDGDGQHNSDDLIKLSKEINKGSADMVIGSRFVCNSGYKSSAFRKIGINYFSKLVSLLCRKSFYDTTSGYRMMNRKALKLFVEYYPQDYPEVETIVYAVKNGLKVKEIGVDMNKRNGGTSSITPIRSIYYMIKVTLALIIQPSPSIKRGV